MKGCFLVCLMLGSVSLQAQLADFQHVNFRPADSVADVYFGAPVTDLISLSHNLTHSFTRDEEKFRAIYKWVCSNIEFDYDVFRINREKRDKFDTQESLTDWNKKITPVVFRHLVEERKTVCSGYAWLVQQLAYHAGLRCVVVDGYGRNATTNIRKSGKPNHSWNAVMLNGKWYLCDATWASGAYDADREVFIKNYDDSYFLADPNVFVRNHYPIDTQWTLLEATTLTEFLNGPLVYSSVYKHHVTGLFPETFDIKTTKNKPVDFRFASTDSMEQVQLAVHGPKKVESIKTAFFKNDEGLYCFNHQFPEKGRHVVHVLLNNHYAFTYTVTVQ